MNKENHLNKDYETMPGHWLLASMGKKVLRPGGKELTLELIDALDISPDDEVVEFAPGLGFTAKLTLKRNPKSYVGIELDQKAVGQLEKIIHGSGRRIVHGTAAETSLKDTCADKVYGEAMLTMQADHRKAEIIAEAHRILRPGGFYGIHELGLVSIESEKQKARIQKDLAKTIRVNARPLTQKEWINLLEEQGFEVVKTKTNGMKLLDLGRMVNDEGLFRTMKIFFNVVTRPEVRKRVVAMRKMFTNHKHNMNAIAIIAKKI